VSQRSCERVLWDEGRRTSACFPSNREAGGDVFSIGKSDLSRLDPFVAWSSAAMLRLQRHDARRCNERA